MKYFVAGKTGIGHLESDYRFRLTPTVYVSARAGYLESMFGGAGGEILWRPEGARWALGADLYQVWQRDFDHDIQAGPHFDRFRGDRGQEIGSNLQPVGPWPKFGKSEFPTNIGSATSGGIPDTDCRPLDRTALRVGHCQRNSTDSGRILGCSEPDHKNENEGSDTHKKLV